MRLQTAVGALRFASYLTVLAPKPAKPDSIPVKDRLASFPTHDVPVEGDVNVYWNEHLVPFIDAETDRGLAFTVGLVQAHLRLGQMETLRRIAAGRISEMVGPVAIELDHTLRMLDLGRAIPEIEANLPTATREWMDGFLDGINHYLFRKDTVLPHEFELFDLKREVWTVTDLLRLARLFAFDNTWLVWLRLLRVRGKPGWNALWRKLIAAGSDQDTDDSVLGTLEQAALDGIMSANNRSGSNCLAVSGRVAGKTWLAGDPHLGLSLPSNWLIMGYRSPSHHAVGMVIPGTSFVAFGRNASIAWGGTSLHGHVSELCDVSDLPASSFKSREETINVRWSSPKRCVVRTCDIGPVLSDSPFYKNAGATLALRWVGHAPSDEWTAMLQMTRARDWHGFKAALDLMAVPGMNMIYADNAGHVGHAMAGHIPRDAHPEPDDMVAHSNEPWTGFFSTTTLPSWFDPARGYVISANDRPQTEMVVGRFYSSPGRSQRIASLLDSGHHVDKDVLARVQRDVNAESARRLARALAVAARSLNTPLSRRATEVISLLEEWDGTYDAESRSATAFELSLYHFSRLFYSRETLTGYAASWMMRDLVCADLEAAKPTEIAKIVRSAIDRCARSFRNRRWGDIHRLRLQHPLGGLPVAGRRYRYLDMPASGSSDTVMKTAAGLINGKHGVRFGANARHISDLSDLDANHFVLLGGQDGFFGSAAFADQVPLWRKSEYVRVPLRPETVRHEFPYAMSLTGTRGARPEPKRAAAG